MKRLLPGRETRPCRRADDEQRLRFGSGSLPSAIVVFTLALLLAGCAREPVRGDPGSGPLAVGDYDFDITQGGRDRYYLLHVPPAAATAGGLPLVLALHGGGGNPGGFAEESGLDAVSDREGFLVAYPAGSGVFARTLLTWNAGADCCGYAFDRQIDDVSFLLAVVEDIAARTRLDRSRVYVTGHSNGGMMTYRLAAEASDRIAAAVPVAGAMMLPTFAPTRPVPLLHIHSVDDPRALYDGGIGPPFPLTNERVTHWPVEDGIDQWADRNGCVAQPTVTEERVGANGSENAGQRAVRLSYQPCAAAPVILWRLHGVGHGWPGTVLSGARGAIVGPSTTLISASEEVWSFVEAHRLP